MTRAYNFAAGPATLPEPVLRQARDEMLDWHGVGASIVELSHRGPEFMQVAAEAEADLRTLLSIPDDYAVLFLGGGEGVHSREHRPSFYTVPMSFVPRLAIALGLNALALWAANALWDGGGIHGWAAYLIGAAVLGIANTVIKPPPFSFMLPVAVKVPVAGS